MKTEKRHHLQDIYATDHRPNDDFTPQVSSRVLEERKRDMRMQQLRTFLLGTTILAVTIALTLFVINYYQRAQKQTDTPETFASKYVPGTQFMNDPEKEWIMDYDETFADPTYNEGDEHPFSALWIQKAAYNLSKAEAKLKLAEIDQEALKTAAMYFENALEIFPEAEGIKVPLGQTYIKMNKFEEAIALLETAKESELTYDVLNNMGNAYIEAQKYDKAEAALQKALKKKPGYDKALKNQAVLYKKQKLTDKAIKAYSKYLAINKTDMETRFEFVAFLTGAGKWSRAKEELNILIEEKPEEAILYELLARVEGNLGNDQAMCAAIRKKAKVGNPNDVIESLNDKEFDQYRSSEAFQQLIKDLSPFKE